MQLLLLCPKTLGQSSSASCHVAGSSRRASLIYARLALVQSIVRIIKREAYSDLSVKVRRGFR